MWRNFTINHMVAVLGLVLSMTSYLFLKRYGIPDKVCVGAAIFSTASGGDILVDSFARCR